ncbi:LysE family translocator [Cohaesibacter haloalkalitolerans]|uniref:LysE family translocator n=1 Tax=Cohaesibacter haloalkalitolerans TaxID=1162980 RepID=UPI000E65AE6D|nr:LysE family translocator [Cohaesibacter haloalkalitolerans]
MFEHFPFLAIILALTALTMAPGMDSVLVLRNAARGGFADGFTTSFGICSGLFVHATISALGLSVILLQSAYLFMVLKFAGALFIIYLASQSLLAAWRGHGLVIAQEGARSVSLLTAYREGILSNVLNPKPILFYMMFLPQFIDPTQSALWQSLMVAAIHFLLGMIWQGGLALMVHKARRFLSRPLVARSLNGATGLLLLVFGIKLALTHR